jgi:hypothetical protein
MGGICPVTVPFLPASVPFLSRFGRLLSRFGQVCPALSRDRPGLEIQKRQPFTDRQSRLSLRESNATFAERKATFYAQSRACNQRSVNGYQKSLLPRVRCSSELEVKKFVSAGDRCAASRLTLAGQRASLPGPDAPRVVVATCGARPDCQTTAGGAFPAACGAATTCAASPRIDDSYNIRITIPVNTQLC